MCKEALRRAGWVPEAFIDAVGRFAARLDHHTDFFKGNTPTKKSAVQFALACCYLHRQGVNIDNRQLFAHSAAFQAGLPKTHSLIEKGYKVRAITRCQDLIKTYLTRAVRQAPGDDWAFPRPPAEAV